MLLSLRRELGLYSDIETTYYVIILLIGILYYIIKHREQVRNLSKWFKISYLFLIISVIMILDEMNYNFFYNLFGIKKVFIPFGALWLVSFWISMWKSDNKEKRKLNEKDNVFMLVLIVIIIFMMIDGFINAN